MHARFLNKDEFAQVVRNTPLVSIDLIIQIGACLLGLERTSPPRVSGLCPVAWLRKYERLADAFARIVKAEIGLEVSIGDAKLNGVYEHLYDNNVFGENGFGTHYVVLAHELRLDHRPPIVSDRQHSDFRWMTRAQLISSPDARLGYGTSGLHGGLSKRPSLRLLEAAFDAGVRHFDTAPMYGLGDSEAIGGGADLLIPPVRSRSLMARSRTRWRGCRRHSRRNGHRRGQGN